MPFFDFLYQIIGFYGILIAIFPIS